MTMRMRIAYYDADASRLAVSVERRPRGSKKRAPHVMDVEEI